MTDARKHDPQSAPVAETAKIEELLLAGLDEYFAGRYEQAIHVWTRALFLDRGHARARAYIERARSALGERQRESEALLHKGIEAFERGDVDEARRLLMAAVDDRGPEDVALSLLQRIDRLDAGPGPLHAPAWTPASAPPRARSPHVNAPSRRRRRRMWLAVALGTTALLLVGLVWWFGDLRQRLRGTDAPGAVAATRSETPLPVPYMSEAALARARALYRRGHAHDALRVLDAIGPGDTMKPDADRLRAEIQLALLGSLPPSTPPPQTLSESTHFPRPMPRDPR
jgi:hypothetical protein